MKKRRIRQRRRYIASPSLPSITLVEIFNKDYERIVCKIVLTLSVYEFCGPFFVSLPRCSKNFKGKCIVDSFVNCRLDPSLSVTSDNVATKLASFALIQPSLGAFTEPLSMPMGPTYYA